MRTIHKMRSGILLAAAIAIPSGVAIAAVSGDDPGKPIGEQGQSLAEVMRADAPRHSPSENVALAARFDVLSEPRAAVSPLGSAADHTHMADVMRAHVILPSSTKGETASEWQTWIAPSSAPDEICVLVLPPAAIGAGGACDTLADAAAGKLTLAMGNLSDGPVVILGAMPDRVDEVVLTMVDGSTRELPVVDNAYRADVTTATRSITFTLPGDDEPTTIESRVYSG